MKKLFQFLTILSSLIFFFIGSDNSFSQIKVAVYNDDGVGSGDAARFESRLTDTTKYKCTEVLGADIRAGILNNFDVILFPGGSGSGESGSLLPEGLDSVRAFIYRGGGYYGTCAGSYLASSDYSWSLHILNTKVVDKAHWNRGNGTIIVDFSNEGKDFFGLSQDSVHIEYRQGALMAPNNIDTLPAYIKLGTFASEIALNGAPSGVMIGTTAFAQSVFGMGRVIAVSPHPEITDTNSFMVAKIVDWVAGHGSFAKFASPLRGDQWTAGVSQAIQWISGGGSDNMSINFSTDNGSTWSQLSASSVNSFDWVVPNSPSALCKLRINSLNRLGIGDTISFVILPPLPAVTSKTSGSWNSASTWVDGILPDSLHDVFISVGHTVTVNSEAKCKSISFGDATGKLALNDNIKIYGNFNCFSNSVNPFYSSSNLWTAGTKMVFTGNAAEQTITNLGTTSSSPYPIRFNELVIDKSTGKFTTGVGSNVKLGIGTSLEVINGTFELASTDDIEGRNTLGTATTPTITVDTGAVFNMVGSSSYIRRGNFTGEESEKIGKMTVLGDVYLACGTTNNISFTNIDIESGGVLYLASSRGFIANTFNPGTITVKNGGILRNSTTTNVWYTNATTPTTVDLQDGGIFVSYSSSTPFPPNINNNGTVRYAASTFNQTVTDANYSRLELSYTGTGYTKNWTLGANRIISDSLETNNSASLVLSAASPQSLSVNGTIRLTSGSINNSNPNVTLSMGNGAEISRATGTISNSPVFSGIVNLKYSSSSIVTTGLEIPSGTSVINNLSITGVGGVTLGSSVLVNGILSLSGGIIITTSSKLLTLGSSATISGGSSSSFVNGPLARVVATTSPVTNVFPVGKGTAYRPLQLTVTQSASTPTIYTAEQFEGSPTSRTLPGSLNSVSSVRYFNITKGTGSGVTAASVQLGYDTDDLVSDASLLRIAKDNGSGSWIDLGGIGSAPTIGTITSTTNFTTFSDFVLANANSLCVLNLTALIDGFYDGSTMVPDTVTVELHNTNSPYNLIDVTKGVLSTTGVGTFSFSNAVNGIPYYIVVKHRNAIETWSAVGNTFASSALSYDFTTAATQAYGSNMVLKSGKYCFWSGDANKDNSINLSDMIIVDNDNSHTAKGYLNSDVNGDGVINLSDMIIVDNSNSKTISRKTPVGAPVAISINRPVKTIKQ